MGLPFLLSCVLVVIRYLVNIDMYDNFPNSSPEIIFFLIIICVLIPLKFIPFGVGTSLKYITENYIMQKNFHMTMRNRSGYGIPGFETGHFMLLPSATNNHRQLASNNAVPNPGFSYFSKYPISRKLFQLKFKIHIFCKCTMHLFYLMAYFLMLNTAHIVLKMGSVEYNTYHLHILRVPEVQNISKIHTVYNIIDKIQFSAYVIIFAMVPILLSSFGLLFLYYKKCHPWLSEGISMGFEPQDAEHWRPFNRGEVEYIRQYFDNDFSDINNIAIEPNWAVGEWHWGAVQSCLEE